MPEESITRAELTVALAFFALLAGIGVFLGGYAVRDFAHARASMLWPRIEGVVLSDEGARFRYAYVADGKTHESHRIRFFTAHIAQKKFERPAAGGKVTVRVSPADSQLAVIQPGGSGAIFALVAAFAGVLVFMGLGGLIRTLLLAREIEVRNGSGKKAPAAQSQRQKSQA
jgi:hypothetical protein